MAKNKKSTPVVKSTGPSVKSSALPSTTAPPKIAAAAPSKPSAAPSKPSAAPSKPSAASPKPSAIQPKPSAAPSKAPVVPSQPSVSSSRPAAPPQTPSWSTPATTRPKPAVATNTLNRSDRVRREWQMFKEWLQIPHGEKEKRLDNELRKFYGPSFDIEAFNRLDPSEVPPFFVELEYKLIMEVVERAKTEWNVRLSKAGLHVDDWTDMTEAEELDVVSVFEPTPDEPLPDAGLNPQPLYTQFNGLTTGNGGINLHRAEQTVPRQSWVSPAATLPAPKPPGRPSASKPAAGPSATRPASAVSANKFAAGLSSHKPTESLWEAVHGGSSHKSTDSRNVGIKATTEHSEAEIQFAQEQQRINQQLNLGQTNPTSHKNAGQHASPMSSRTTSSEGLWSSNVSASSTASSSPPSDSPWAAWQATAAQSKDRRNVSQSQSTYSTSSASKGKALAQASSLTVAYGHESPPPPKYISASALIAHLTMDFAYLTDASQEEVIRQFHVQAAEADIALWRQMASTETAQALKQKRYEDHSRAMERRAQDLVQERMSIEAEAKRLAVAAQEREREHTREEERRREEGERVRRDQELRKEQARQAVEHEERARAAAKPTKQVRKKLARVTVTEEPDCERPLTPLAVKKGGVHKIQPLLEEITPSRSATPVRKPASGSAEDRKTLLGEDTSSATDKSPSNEKNTKSAGMFWTPDGMPGGFPVGGGSVPPTTNNNPFARVATPSTRPSTAVPQEGMTFFQPSVERDSWFGGSDGGGGGDTYWDAMLQADDGALGSDMIASMFGAGERSISEGSGGATFEQSVDADEDEDDGERLASAFMQNTQKTAGGQVDAKLQANLKQTNRAQKQVEDAWGTGDTNANANVQKNMNWGRLKGPSVHRK